MEFTKEIIDRAAALGSKKVAEAFAKISGSSADIGVTRAEAVALDQIQNIIQVPDEHSIIVYSEFLAAKPVAGMTLLILGRKDSLSMVDLLNHQPVGTTGILKDIDRSAIKETLNILSNSYMAALGEVANIEIGIGVPNMTTKARIDEILGQLSSAVGSAGEYCVYFATSIAIQEFKIEATIYLIFSNDVPAISNNQSGTTQ